MGFQRSFFHYLERHAGDVLSRKPSALAHILLESVAIKAAVVANDERETGVRWGRCTWPDGVEVRGPPASQSRGTRWGMRNREGLRDAAWHGGRRQA